MLNIPFITNIYVHNSYVMQANNMKQYLTVTAAGSPAHERNT